MNESAQSRFVTSSDGTRVAVYESGEGPVLALVYGALMEQTGWARQAPPLQPGRRLLTYDRRGRGVSGDQPAYAVEREVDDLEAVLRSIDGPFDVFAHSSGALLALMAAERVTPRRMVLYEPPQAGIRDPQLTAELAGEIDALVKAGDRDAALRLFMRHGMTLSESEVERLRAGPRWAEQLGYVHTSWYDVTVTRTYAFDRAKLARLTMPVLLLVGGESPSWMRRGVAEFAAALPNSRLAELPGQGHNAIFGAPEMVAREVNAFLASNLDV
ncbi:MAG TPA: alpha/beta hydrolase [Dehalococcoidia bacterium]|nr:alpha/beta hydrolase [Dehalococcoidia bacterium]